MDESLKTGLVLTVGVCLAGWVIGGINSLLPCIIFCSILWIAEIRERRPPIQVKKCKHCGSKVRMRDQKTEWQYENVGLCPLCIEKIFRYSH